MSNTIKAIVVLGTAFVLSACAQEEPMPMEEPMVMEEPTMDKM